MACAIFGWNGKMTNPVLRRLFFEARNWGPHSAGLVYYDEAGVNAFKRAVDPCLFLRNNNHRVERAAEYRLGYGHVRYATHGAVIDENAHPYGYSTHTRKLLPLETAREQDDIIFCHNGVIQNYQEIAREKGLGHIIVDSQCLAPLIVDKELGRSQGSTAVLWVTNGKLYCYKHWQNLVASECRVNGEKTIIVASRDPIILGCRHIPGFEVVRSIKMDEYVAYEVTPDGLIPIWDNFNKATPRYGYTPSCSAKVSRPSIPLPKIEAVSVVQPVEVEHESSVALIEAEDIDAEAESEQAAQKLVESYDLLIISTDDGRVQVYTNAIEQVYEAVSEFISADELHVTLSGAYKGEGGTEWATTMLARWIGDGEVEYRDRNVKALSEFVTR